ncbi:hypothetical protein EIN_025590 [Entamoeba invadens IP1]|uniref:hypothetical protein n=1 Tax=Entamoeba invadens IP1 TaxID=370355 RepID=UPI0002C3F4F1|nr:hypothetical protein EIN_025590 [Entamoeba invadens IP1]ELP90730.1 hypothetical protein EIN_025590 [Entamoeba invadens IP1]|eukprot:XP_004257501.1 hypothetical protein EIN_025590 [Entamoeba invadens IP1]
MIASYDPNESFTENPSGDFYFTEDGPRPNLFRDSKSPEFSNTRTDSEFDFSCEATDVQLIDLETFEDYPIFEEEKENLKKVYDYMMSRKKERKKNAGKDMTQSHLTLSVLSFVLFLDFLYLDVNMLRLKLFTNYYEYYVITFLFSFLFIQALHYGISNIIYFTGILYAFVYIYTLTRNIVIVQNDRNKPDVNETGWFYFIIGLFTLIVVITLFHKYLMPFVQKYILSRITALRYTTKKVVSKTTQQTKYEFENGKIIFMIKQLDQHNLNKMSGFGTWVDNSFHGEHLDGYFDLGIPVGPFKSVESKTPNIFKSIRIIFASNAGGKLFIEKTKLGYGVASVECCVSGEFYMNYPLVNYIQEKVECSCPKRMCFCVDQIIKKHLYFHLDENAPVTAINVFVDQNEKCLYLPGYSTKDQKKRKEVVVTVNKSKSALSVDSHWISLAESISEGNIEALLFIHGLDHTLYDALRRMGQMLALGNFPQHIVPFVFNWPSSQNAACYYCAANNACDRNQHRDFYNFLKSLENAGVKRIHIMCHSLGSKFFMQSYLLVQTLFEKVEKKRNESNSEVSENDDEKSVERDTQRMKFANLILLNSDYEVDTFVDDYNELKERCEHVTIYADQRDSALSVSNFLTKKNRLGANITPLMSNGVVLENIDIIDTSELDRNINEARHGFFNINKVMIDDIFDIVVNSKKAENRVTRLLKVNGIYRFSLLPSFSQMRFSSVEKK